MRISAKTEYGILALLHVTCHAEEKPVAVQTMARQLKIPRRFLEQIVMDFKKHGLIRSIRGAHGGYVLAKPPESITMADVLAITEGPFHTWSCVTEKDNFYCSLENVCAVHTVWQEIQNSVDQILRSFNLKQMSERTRHLKHRQEVLIQAWAGVGE